MSLVDIWQALADAGAAGLPAVNCTPFEPAVPTPPALFPILPESGTYIAAFQGDETVDFTVTVRLVLCQLDQSVATENLLPYIGPAGSNSVKAALEADPTLGGTVESISMTGWSGAGTVTYGSVEYLACDFTADILASA